jgi:hypothetical protein
MNLSKVKCNKLEGWAKGKLYHDFIFGYVQFPMFLPSLEEWGIGIISLSLEKYYKLLWNLDMIVGSLKQYLGGCGSMASGFCTALYPSLYAQCFTQLAFAIIDISCTCAAFVEQFFYEHMRKKCESLSSSQRQSERSF